MDIIITIIAALVIMAVGWLMVDKLLDSVLGLVGMWVTIMGFVALTLLPVSNLVEVGKVQTHLSLQQTVEDARASNDGLEGVAFRMKIAETNAWLAKAQYWNETVFSGYIPDAVSDLEPVR